jgi:hypothetical protein
MKNIANLVCNIVLQKWKYYIYRIYW